MATIHLTEQDFLKRVVDYVNNPTEWKFLGDKPAIVDFYATWCGPCKMLSPVLEELSAEYAGKVDIYKVDVDAESGGAGVCGIRSVPSLLFVPMQGNPRMVAGALPKHELKRAIEEVLQVK